MKINTLFEQFIEGRQFVRLATFVLLADIFFNVIDQSGLATTPIAVKLIDISLQDLIMVFFIVLLIRVYWTIIIIFPYSLLRFYAEIEKRLFDKDADYTGLWQFCFNVWAFTDDDKNKDHGFAAVVYYCACFYYTLLSFWFDSMAVHLIADSGAILLSDVFNEPDANVWMIYAIEFAVLAFLFPSAFYGAFVVFHNLKTANSKSQTETLRQQNEDYRRETSIRLQRSSENQIFHLSENQRRLFLIEFTRLRMQRRKKK